MTKKLLFDGECPMCVSAANWLSPRTQVQLTALQGFQPPVGLAEEALLREIHLVDESGRYWAGAPALAEALRESPKLAWRVTGRAMSLPVVSHVADFVYRQAAKNRRRVAI